MSNRILKFRAWDPENKKMVSINHLKLPVIGGFKFLKGPQAPLMQYTGLKDKNGKEIYEFDIIRNNHSIGVVEFYEGKFRWEPGQDWGEIEQCEVEVIGNIYEHDYLN